MGGVLNFPWLFKEDFLIAVAHAYDVYICVRSESAPKNHPNYAVVFDAGEEPAQVLRYFYSLPAVTKFVVSMGKYMGQHPFHTDDLKLLSPQELKPLVLEAAEYALDIYLANREANGYTLSSAENTREVRRKKQKR